MAALYAFFREISDENETRFTQSASVYAANRDEAEGILRSYLASLREAAPSERDSREFEDGSWSVEEIALDEARVLSLAATGWPE